MVTILPENILRLMSPKDRAALGKAGVSKAEAEARFIARNERQLQRLIAKELNRREIWFHRAAMHKKTTGTLGTPDFLFALNGAACAIEVKFAAGRLRSDQEQAIEQMTSNGWRCAVVYTFQEFIKFLKGLE